MSDRPYRSRYSIVKIIVKHHSAIRKDLPCLALISGTLSSTTQATLSSIATKSARSNAVPARVPTPKMMRCRLERRPPLRGLSAMGSTRLVYATAARAGHSAGAGKGRLQYARSGPCDRRGLTERSFETALACIAVSRGDFATIKAMANEILLVANGDLRLSANRMCWPAQRDMESKLTAAIEGAGGSVRRAHEYNATKEHGFIDSQKRGLRCSVRSIARPR